MTEPPTRIPVPDPEPAEESRQLIEHLADLHYVMGIVVANAEHFLPGESIDELRFAWANAGPGLEKLIRGLTPPPKGKGHENEPAGQPVISHAKLVEAELTGATGAAKRGFWRRLRDAFLSFWKSEPRTDEKTRKAMEAGKDYFEFSETILGSLASVVEGHPYIHGLAEIASLIGQLFGVRLKRGH
jgi:hypothetical protein